jgi:cytochrome c peroxidase
VALRKSVLSTIIFWAFVGLSSGCSKQEPEPYQWNLPSNFPEPIVPENNPMTTAKVMLGKKLFYDKQLSYNQTMSCGSCHIQALGFAESNTVAVGSTGQVHRRNTQPLLNVAYNSNLTWAHSGLTRLEQQILIPMFGEQPIELGITGHEDEVLSRFKSSDYQKLFDQAFPDENTSFDHIVKALASFVRSMVSFESDFDKYAYQNDDTALSDSQIRGMNLFFSERFECFHCHGGFNFTQSSKHEQQQLDLKPFHNTGLYNEDGQGRYPVIDQGLIEVSRQAKDMGRFRAPTLRNISLTAPYMHDGSIETLEEVIDFYAQGGRGLGRTSPLKNAFVKGIDMTEEERQDLLNFLASLTDDNFTQDRNYSQYP